MSVSTTKSKKMVRVALLLAAVCSLFFVPWILVKAWIMPLPNTVQLQLEESVEHGFEGVIAYIHQTGEKPKYLASGWHNREAKSPANPHALFKIASINKLYVAVAVTKLVSSKQLDLNKSLAEYLPALKGQIENADNITLKMMVQHRSGIPNFTDTPDFWAAPTKSFEESFALISGKPANFKPDTSYEYSNTNYLLLNRIMDDTLGHDNFTFIKEQILNPLSLERTYRSLVEVDLDDVMSGYHVGYPYDLKEDDHGMLATAEDVGIFLRALNDGSVFKAGEQEVYNSIYKLEHAGWVPGYQSFANYNSDLDAVVVTFYNTTDADLLNWNLSEIINNRIFDILKKQSNK